MANVPKSVVNDAKRKAAELENFDCKKKRKTQIVLSNDDGLSADASKDVEVQSALKMLNSFRNLPIDTMSLNEQRNALIELLA